MKLVTVDARRRHLGHRALTAVAATAGRDAGNEHVLRRGRLRRQVAVVTRRGPVLAVVELRLR